VAGLDGKPGDPIFEQKQTVLNMEALIKDAMLPGFAAADAVSRDGYEFDNTFDGLNMIENGEEGEEGEDVVEK
jgi:hypothetical protein